MIQQWWTRHAGTPGDLSSPLIMCDECGEAITDATRAVVLFPAWGPAFLHKDQCDRAWCSAHPGADTAGTFELVDWLTHLVVNAGMAPNADVGGRWWHREPGALVLVGRHQYPVSLDQGGTSRPGGPT